MDKYLFIFRYGCLIASVVLLGIGIFLEQHTEVFSKAIHICLECIGIG